MIVYISLLNSCGCLKLVLEINEEVKKKTKTHKSTSNHSVSIALKPNHYKIIGAEKKTHTPAAPASWTEI